MKITILIVANLTYLHCLSSEIITLWTLHLCTDMVLHEAHFRDFTLPEPCVSIAMFHTHSCCLPYKGFWNLQTKKQQKTIEAKKKNPRFFYISLSTEEGLKKNEQFEYCNLFHISNQIKQEQNKITWRIMNSIITIARFQWVVCSSFPSFSSGNITTSCKKSSLIRKKNL